MTLFGIWGAILNDFHEHWRVPTDTTWPWLRWWRQVLVIVSCRGVWRWGFSGQRGSASYVVQHKEAWCCYLCLMLMFADYEALQKSDVVVARNSLTACVNELHNCPWPSEPQTASSSLAGTYPPYCCCLPYQSLMPQSIELVCECIWAVV